MSAKPQRKCRVYDCENKSMCKDLCKTHYQRMRRHTDPEYRKMTLASNKKSREKHPIRTKRLLRRWLKSEKGKHSSNQSHLKWAVKNPDAFRTKPLKGRGKPKPMAKSRYDMEMRKLMYPYIRKYKERKARGE